MCFSPRAANTMQGRSAFVFLDAGLCSPFSQERTWQTRPKERTTRPTPTQPSSTLRATMRTQKKRKNTSFRLQGELCSSLLPPFNPCISFSLSLSVSPFSSPPLTTAPIVSTRNPQAAQPVFFYYYLLLGPFLSFTSRPFFLSSSFDLAAGVRRQLAVAAEVAPSLILFLIFDMNAWKSVSLPWLLLTWALVHPLLRFPPSRHPEHIRCPLCSHASTNTYHISHQHGA